MEPKKRKHVIADKVPWLVAVLLMIVGIALPSAIANPISNALGGSEKTIGIVSRGVVAMLVSFAMMWLYRLWFKPEFEGNLGKDGFAEGMKLLIPFFGMWLVYYILNGLFNGARYGFADIAVWTSGMAAGVTEEVAFRGLATTTLLRKYRSEKNVWMPGVAIGVLFGAVHLMNLTAGDDVVFVLLTVVFAIAGGIVFGAVYTKCGNLWAVILAHGIYDSISFSILEDPNDTTIEIGAFSYLQIAIMTLAAVLALVALIKKKREASDLWNRKWNTIV